MFALRFEKASLILYFFCLCLLVCCVIRFEPSLCGLSVIFGVENVVIDC